MLLTEPEIQQVLEQAKAAFPNFTDWEYNNDKNEEYFGFSIWGQFVLDEVRGSPVVARRGLSDLEDLMPQRFFITFDTYEEKWQGHLTTGQPCYLWSSADVGDAHLLNTESCESLENAIAALKTKIVELFRAFSSNRLD